MNHVLEKWYLHYMAGALTLLPQKSPTLYTGSGSIKFLPAELASHAVQKPLLVTDKALVENGVAGRIMRTLEMSGSSYAIFDGIVSEPTFEMCRKAIDILKKEECDSVVAVGGGWVMDACKIIRMGATHSKPLEKFKGRLKCRNAGLPFICIPTAAGTGSEATSFAMIMDPSTRKEALVMDPKLPSDIAILDPDLTLEIPASITALAGMHTLAHAIEAYTNTLHYSDVDAQALEVARLVFGNLKTACSDGKNISAREAMLRAAHLGGKATTKGFLGYIHAVAHRFGERYDITRGLAVAITMPYFLRRYVDACPQRLADLARAGGIEARIPARDSDRFTEHSRESALALVDAVTRLGSELGIPEKAAFLERKDIDGIVEAVLSAIRSMPSPVPVVFDAAECAAILESMLA
jgi:alcohol dehydrogenase class IV